MNLFKTMVVSTVLVAVCTVSASSITVTSGYFTVNTIDLTLSASDGTVPGGIEVIWTDGGCEQYELFRGMAKNGPFNRIAVVSTNAYFDSSVEWGRPYWYYVASNGTSSESDEGVAGDSGDVPTISKIEVSPLWLRDSGGMKQVRLTWKGDTTNRYNVSKITFNVASSTFVTNHPISITNISLDDWDVGIHGSGISLQVEWDVERLEYDTASGSMVPKPLPHNSAWQKSIFIKIYYDKYGRKDGIANWFRYWKQDRVLGGYSSHLCDRIGCNEYDGKFHYGSSYDGEAEHDPRFEWFSCTMPLHFPKLFDVTGQSKHRYWLGDDSAANNTAVRRNEGGYTGPTVGEDGEGADNVMATITHERQHSANEEGLRVPKKLLIGEERVNIYALKDSHGAVLFSSFENFVSKVEALHSTFQTYKDKILSVIQSGNYTCDLDGDMVNDIIEPDIDLSPTSPDTYTISKAREGWDDEEDGYQYFGDDEYLARKAESKLGAQESADWGFPGYNIDPECRGDDNECWAEKRDSKIVLHSLFAPKETIFRKLIKKDGAVSSTTANDGGGGQLLELPELSPFDGNITVIGCDSFSADVSENGKIRSLVFTVSVTNITDAPVSCRITGYLSGSNDCAVSWAQITKVIPTGTSAVTLKFDGRHCYRSGTNGFRLKFVEVRTAARRRSALVSIAENVADSDRIYSWEEFERNPLYVFADGISSQHEDDGLKFSIPISSAFDGTAKVSLSLMTTTGVHVAITESDVELHSITSANNILQETVMEVGITVPSEAIYISGMGGPYEVECVEFSTNGVVLAREWHPYITSDYSCLDFRGNAAVLSIDKSSFTSTTQRDTYGKVSSLDFAFDVSNCLSSSVSYNCRACLANTNGTMVCEKSTPLLVEQGRNVVNLRIAGTDILKSGIDGPYGVTEILLEPLGGVGIKERFIPVHFPIDLKVSNFGGVPFTVKGVPQYCEADGKTPAAVLVTVDVARPDTITASALLVDGEGKYVATAMTSETVGEVGERTLTLTFNPDDVNASRRRGPYTISYLLLKSGIQGVDDVRLEDFEVQNVGDSSLKVFVDAVNGDDANDGFSATTAKRSITAAIDAAADGDKVVVADGVYEPFTCANRSIVIESVNGPRYTIIDGGGTNRCATLGTSAGHTNTVLRGFTLRNGNASNCSSFSRCGGGVLFGTLEYCYVCGNCAYPTISYGYGGGVYAANLIGCIVSGNIAAYGGGVCVPRQANALSVTSCTFSRNKGAFGAAVYFYSGSGPVPILQDNLLFDNGATSDGTAYDAISGRMTPIVNCTIVDNWTAGGSAGIAYISAINSISWGNIPSRPLGGYSNYGSSVLTNCCTYPLASGVGNIAVNPQFVDAEHHVYWLKPESPCVGTASDGENMGALGIAPENGITVGTETDGYGLILEPGTVVAAGGSATFTAAEIGREFLHFKTNGVFATTDRIIELTNIHDDILVTAVFAKREYFVDAISGNDRNEGLSWATARKTIGSAINDAVDYDTITVADGIYATIVPLEKRLWIRSVNGAGSAIIDGGRTNSCVDCMIWGVGCTNATIVGFTLKNGYTTSYGGGAVGGTLRDCCIIECESMREGGGAYQSHLINCVVARNKAGTYGGGLYYGVADHCTICGNEAGASGGGTYYGTINNCIVSKNVVGGSEANWSNGTFDSCCTYPNRGSNPIVGDPLLVDGWNGDARLRVGSPCIVNGVQVCGAYIGEPVEGVCVSVGVQGVGAVSNETILVTSGGSVTIEAVETVRPFLYWNINGEQIADRVYTLTNITSDIRAIAVFGSFDWYVDAEYGDDANDGSNWGVAKRTLQAAVAAAVDDETIYVEAGTYGPISTDNKRIRIESMNGAEMTFIDGGGMNRCATLGTISTHTNSALIGFTLLNGRAPQSGSYAYGGGSYYGTLEYCIISNCVANGYYAYGGGAYCGYLNNCLVAYNCATSSSYVAYGGGTYSAVLRSCTVARNYAAGANAAYAGGTYGNGYSAYNTIIWGNEVGASNASSAYYPDSYNQSLYYCCTSSSSDRRYSGTITNDPQFVDADAGDFHLMVGSPCLNAGYNNYVQGDMDLDWDDRIQGAAVDMGCYEGAEYAAPPGRVTGLVAVRRVLTWDAMPDAEGFMVYRSTRRAASSAKYIGMSDTNTYIDETAVEGTTYYYWVTAFNTLGMGTRSEVTENTWPDPLAITTTALPDGRVHDAYSVQLQATGGGQPYRWEAVVPGYVASSNDSTFAATGTAQGWHVASSSLLALPFDFQFYGGSYHAVYVNSNGTISFGNPTSGYGYYNHDYFLANPMIAVMWQIFNMSGDYDIYVESSAESVKIRWDAAYNYYAYADAEVNFSATLHADGRIVLSYGDGNAYGGMCGISAGDGKCYRVFRNDSTSWGNAEDISLAPGGYDVLPASLPGGLTLTQDGLLSGVAAESGVFTAYARVTDVIGDSVVAEFPLSIERNPWTFHVDAAGGDDANDGLTAATAKQSIQRAIDVACDDDTIIVSDGVYTPISTDDRRIRIESENGAAVTFIDGGGTNRCATLAGSSGLINGQTNSVLVGFTLLNGRSPRQGSNVYGGGSYGGTLNCCVISNCFAADVSYTPSSMAMPMAQYAYGGGAYYGNLNNCLVAYNCATSYYAYGGGTYGSNLRSCTITKNSAVGSNAAYAGGTCYNNAYNTIIWDNEARASSASNAFYPNTFNQSLFYCCADRLGYSGTITNDPQFVDADAGDFRLAVGSPCLDAGDNSYVSGDCDVVGVRRILGGKVDMGCYEGAVYAELPGEVGVPVAVRGRVRWSVAERAQAYEVMRSETGSVSDAIVVATVYETEWMDEEADNEHLWWYWVRGKNSLGTGALGDAVQMMWPDPLAISTVALPNAMEMVPYNMLLEAAGGVAPYSWSCPDAGYTVTTNLISTFTEVGTAQGWISDDASWEFSLPFAFPFYGDAYTRVFVNDNGTLSFGHGVSNYYYNNNTFTNTPMIAAMWADLIANPGDVYVMFDPSSVTFRWERRYWGSTSLEYNFSMTLYPDGRIKFAYGSGNVNGGFVGVSAGDGENFIIVDGSYHSCDNAPDMVLKPSGLPGGLSLSDDGEITGIPTAMGTNTLTVTVTDAIGDTVDKELSIVVNENTNHKPEIDAVSPTTNVYVKVGDSTTFAVTAHDPEGETLEYIWYLDGEEIECFANSYTFTATLDDAGAHTLECVVSDGLWTDMVRHKWSFRVIRDWYVDASAEDDSGDGSSADSALYTISEAVWYAEDGDTIYVAPGTYEDYLEFYSDRTVSIVATGGASCTFFTGQIDGYSTQWYSGSTVIQSSMTGFTFRGCYLNGTTLHGCVLTCDETGCYPSEAYGCRLFDCSVTGNTSDYSPIEQCELTRCTVAGNTVGEYGAVGYSSYVYDCIVWDNVTVNGETSNYDTETLYDEWWDDDAEEYVSEEYVEVHIFNSCTWPMPSGIAGTGNITSDPRLVDAVNGDLRLRVGSPCLVGGVQTMGVYLGDPVAGFVLSVRIEGSGAVSPMTAVVSNGGNATFEVADNTRPFLGFSTNGVFATAADTLIWQGVKSDGIITAVFSNFTFYVDAAAGDDANDGLSWATARASIQSAINDAVRGETIYVKAGTYAPIVVGAAMRLRIESVDGKEATVIDGGGECQCANLGGNDSFSSTLVGFTLTNGYSNYGGGAAGGKLVDCDVIGNTATYRGGGLNYSTAIRCRIMNNVVSPQGGYGYGGGAYGGTLINSLVINNVVDETSYYGYGGGTSQSYLYNCTVVGNEAHGMYYVYGGGVQSGGLYNTIVFGNSLVAEGENTYTYGEDVYNNGWYSQYNCLVGDDPGFVDAENGDYRLAADSPCIDAGGNNYVMEDTDLDGNARIQHYTVDIGCYEYELATPERDADADFAAQMAGTCYGVFVGVGRYTYTSSLTGPTIDATNMQTRCVAKGYWRDENTVAFLDAAATKSVVRARLATLAAKAVSGDTVLYYQSSHGGNNYDQYGNMTKDTCICLHDETYEDYEMAEDLMQFAAGVKVVIVLDTCHSAGMFKAVKGTSPASTKSFALRVRELMSERAALRKGAKSGIATDDIGWIAAADYNQYSYDSPRGGAFTVAMLDGWKSGAADYDGDKRLNFHELWRYAKGIAVGYGGSDASDAQCLNEKVLLSRFAGVPDSSSNGDTTETTPAPVEHVWLDAYPEVLSAFGGDYEAMASAPSPGASGNGKTWPNGLPCYVWQDFVAGTSPTNDTVFTATIRMDGNTPVITWSPDTPELRATRVYKTLGKKTLMDKDWVDMADKDKSEYHFFKVTVDLP